MTKKLKKSISLGLVASMFVVPAIASAASFSGEGYYESTGAETTTFVPENGYPSMGDNGANLPQTWSTGERFVDPGIGPGEDLKINDPYNGHIPNGASYEQNGRFVDPTNGKMPNGSEDVKPPYDGNIPKHLEGKTIPSNRGVENHWYFGKDGIWHEKEEYKGQRNQAKNQEDVQKYQRTSEQRQIEAARRNHENAILSLYRKLTQLVDRLIREINAFSRYLDRI